MNEGDTSIKSPCEKDERIMSNHKHIFELLKTLKIKDYRLLMIIEEIKSVLTEGIPSDKL